MNNIGKRFALLFYILSEQIHAVLMESIKQKRLLNPAFINHKPDNPLSDSFRGADFLSEANINRTTGNSAPM